MATLDTQLLRFLETEDILPASVLRALQERSCGEEQAFERLLVDEGHMTDAQVSLVRAQLHGWKSADLRKQPVAPETKGLLPRAFAEAREVLAFGVSADAVSVATTRPADGALRRVLEKKFGKGVVTHYVTGCALRDALRREYDQDALRKLERLSSADTAGGGEDAVVDLLDALLLHGARERASDIHIEPAADAVAVRLRVDGLLRKVAGLSRQAHAQIVQRIKVLSDLATDEHAQPQDGKFTMDLDGKRADIRVSIVPTTHGEDVVLRLLVSEHQAMPLETLGLDEEQRGIVEEEMRKAWGMMLVTGPTGSGKTTTLYATVLKIQSEELNIASIEDPVEYDLPGTNQIQVHEKVGVTFAGGLRSLLRHDPNVILVGEIRDGETAGIAVNAALTGHLVLSTLHTNDAATAIPRLRDMGLEPFLLSSTVNLVIAQRLVRTVCTGCRESHELSAADVRKMLPEEAAAFLLKGAPSVRLYKGKGCAACHGKGYRGRIGIFEFLQMDETIRGLVMRNADADAIRKAAVEAGMRTIVEDGLGKTLAGLTTIEEVLRVIRL